MSQPDDWLPPEASLQEPVRRVLALAVAEWSKNWFAGRQVQLRHMEVVRPVRDAAKGGSQGTFTLETLPNTRARLLGWALNVDLENLETCQGDNQVLDALDNRILDDLVTRLNSAALLAPSASPRDPGASRLRVEITDVGGAHLLAASVPSPMLVPLIRRVLPVARDARTKLTPLVRAIGSQTVSIEVLLGRCDISLPDLRNLGVGDLVILETEVGQPVTLSTKGAKQVCACAEMTHMDGEIALRLVDRAG